MSARITRYVLASPGGDTNVIVQTPGVYVCCQVWAYRRASMALVDDIDVIIEAGSEFVCIVALRCHHSDDPVITAVPLPEIQANTIPAVEFMLGYGHGMAVPTVQPPPPLPPFATGWVHYQSVAATDAVSARAQLAASFLAADPVTGATIDMGTEPVSFVSPPGTVTSQVPADFVMALTRIAGTVDIASDSGSDPPLREPLQGPLLQRDAVVITPIRTPVVPTSSLPSPVAVPSAAPAASIPPVAVTVPIPAPAPSAAPATPPGLTPTEPFLFTMVQDLRADNARRDADNARREAQAEQRYATVTLQMTQFAQAMASFQQPQLQAAPVLQIAPPVDEPRASAPAIPNTGPTSQARTGVTYDADRDAVERSLP